MRIVFFGTPEFAVASLRALLRERFTLAGVVTQPDKPQGRSRSTLVPPAVKVAALEAGLPVLQPARPVGDLFLASLRRLEADLGVVVAYGHILRREVLDAPARGMVNVHASLLPRFRGAAPIQHAILAGDRETGISIMRMEEGLDSGPVLHRVSTPIADGETAGSLTDRLATLGADARWWRRSSLLSAGAGAPAAAGRRPRRPTRPRSPASRPGSTGAETRPRWSGRCARSIRSPAPGPRSTARRSSSSAACPRSAAASRAPCSRPRTGWSSPAGAGAIAVREVQPAGRNRLTGGGVGARPRHRRGEPLRVRPLPRLHAITDAAVIAAPDFAARAAAIAAAGSAVALHARDRIGRRRRPRAGRARGWWRSRRPPEAAVFVNARPDVAQAVGRTGRSARRAPTSARPRRGRRFPSGWIGRSVHSRARGRAGGGRGRGLSAGGQRLPDAVPSRAGPPPASRWCATPRGSGSR